MGDLKQILRMVSPEECQALQDICEYNDITEDQLVSAPETIRSVEMFMHNLPRICCMSFFPNLVSLSLVQQNLGGIHGLHNCPYLEVLRLNENNIQRIEGLDGCFRLKELYLHSNQIHQIRNLSHLSSLEVLWLANNQIKKVEGLENLGRLKELNLACSMISQLGEIVNLKMLEHLNVAATGIGSFKESGHLARLKYLKDLRFADPNWGSSPIAFLHNYQTYMLFRLQHLLILDSQELTDEAKQSAKATYTRKRVYYNMCIKSLQHNKENIASLAVKSESRRARSLQKTLAKLLKNQKDLRQQMKQAHEFQESIRMSKASSFVGVEQSKRQDWWLHTRAMLTTLENQISHIMARLDTLREDIHVVKAKEKAAVDRKIHWLKVELDTGGNSRMEIGNPKDVWFKNCDNLVTSKFSPVDYSPFGISGVRVLKVIRVHSRFLQDRWEKSFEGKVVKSRKKHVEYLLYGETLQSADEFQCIVEEGFPYLPGQSNHGCHGPVLLSNSIGLADVRRLQVIAEQLQTENSWSVRSPGWLLVVKAYLGCSVQDLTVNLASPAAKKSTYPGADSVYRLHPSDPVQRSWFVFDSTLVVPEYLVEFQYTYQTEYGGGELSQRVSAKQRRMLLSKDSEETTPDKSWKCIPFLDPVQCSSKVALSVNSQNSPHNARSHRTKAADKTASLSNDMLLKNHTITDFSKVIRLNLHNNNINEIDSLRGLVNLKVLELSFNKITRIKGLEGLSSLEKLDLSYNVLKRIEGLAGLMRLEELDLAGNEIWCSTDLRLLHTQVPGLLILNLRNNPIEDAFGYRQMVIRFAPSICELNCIPVSSEERLEAKNSCTSTATYVMPNSFSEWKFTMPSVFTGHEDMLLERSPGKAMEEERGRSTGFDQLKISSKLNMLKKVHNHAMEGTQKDDSWYDEVEELHLEDQKLKRMDFFGKLQNLRRLFLSSNEISIIEGLENSTLLEELILDNNHIEQVKALPQLQALWKLDLSRNYLTSCEHINGFGALTQLSIEKNYIESLKGLSGLTCLMELYAANNQISDMREILHIRELPKLMVVDLSGNSLCLCADYRTYSIFSMKKLKVLDGRIITSTEVAEAREKHIGRLTRESLEERLECSCFNGIEVLDLSGRSLRHCGDVFQGKDLHGLTELNLNNNFLSYVHGLRFLRKLLVLRVENNNIENGPLIESVLPDSQYSSSACVGDQQITTTCTAQELPSFRAYNGLESLAHLQLARNAISSIASLNLQQTFSNIRVLSLQDNRITKLDGLEGLKHLEKLYLDHNSIKEIDAFSFAGLYNLKLLHMSDNVLRVLSHLEHLTSLETLDLASNYLTSNRLGGLSSIDCLVHLPKLADLSLANNPMSRQPFYRVGVINKLRQLHCLDGREILEDEREEADVFSTGHKELSISLPNMDTNGLLENPSSLAVTAGHMSQGKVPLKVTSINFETMCGPPTSPRHANSNLNANINTNNTSTSITNNTNATASGKLVPLLNNSIGSKLWESLETKHIIHRNINDLSKSKSKVDTSKVIVVPVLLMKNFRNVRERNFFDSLK